jgi:hypothetical protein
MTERTFESQFAELSSLLYEAAHTGDIVAFMSYKSRIAALENEQLDIANARIAELEAALGEIADTSKPNESFEWARCRARAALNPTTEEAP